MNDRRSRFEHLVLPHLDSAYRLARWLCGSSADAEDLVQEAILRAYRGFDALRGEDAKAWLLVIVRHSHYSTVQQRQRRPTQPLPEDFDIQHAHRLIASAPGPEAQAIAADERNTLVKWLLQLPQEQREVLVLRDIEGLSYREIATVIGAPIGTVMSRLARARAALKTRGDELGGNAHALR